MVRILQSLLSIEPESMNTLLKLGLFGALLVLTGTAVSAQSQDPSHVEPCGHHNAEELLFLRHPETRFAAMEAERQRAFCCVQPYSAMLTLKERLDEAAHPQSSCFCPPLSRTLQQIGFHAP